MTDRIASCKTGTDMLFPTWWPRAVSGVAQSFQGISPLWNPWSRPSSAQVSLRCAWQAKEIWHQHRHSLSFFNGGLLLKNQYANETIKDTQDEIRFSLRQGHWSTKMHAVSIERLSTFQSSPWSRLQIFCRRLCQWSIHSSLGRYLPSARSWSLSSSSFWQWHFLSKQVTHSESVSCSNFLPTTKTAHCQWLMLELPSECVQEAWKGLLLSAAEKRWQWPHLTNFTFHYWYFSIPWRAKDVQPLATLGQAIVLCVHHLATCQVTGQKIDIQNHSADFSEKIKPLSSLREHLSFKIYPDLNCHWQTRYMWACILGQCRHVMENNWTSWGVHSTYKLLQTAIHPPPSTRRGTPSYSLDLWCSRDGWSTSWNVFLVLSGFANIRHWLTVLKP